MPKTVMTLAAAETVTAEIRAVAGLLADNLTRLRGLVERARDGGADIALGYRSWTAYLADVVGPVHSVDREQRRAITSYLADQGMSTRAIAPIVGTSHQTVANDLAAGVKTLTPVVVDADPEPDIDADAPTGPPPQLRIVPIEGLDGKTYQRPVMPPPPHRVISEPTPLPVSDDDFARVLINLKTAARELTRLTTDQRFSADRFARHGPQLEATVKTLSAAVARFDQSSPVAP